MKPIVIFSLIFFVFGIFLTNLYLNLKYQTHFEHGYEMHGMMMHGHEGDGQRDHFISLRREIQDEQRAQEKYACCLKIPCIYCIEKTPNHGEAESCRCLDDVMNGRHPCGECIGEILEGHGNPLIAKYFAKSIAEEVGPDHIDMLKQIIAGKYNISIEDQI